MTSSGGSGIVMSEITSFGRRAASTSSCTSDRPTSVGGHRDPTGWPQPDGGQVPRPRRPDALAATLWAARWDEILVGRLVHVMTCRSPDGRMASADPRRVSTVRPCRRLPFPIGGSPTVAWRLLSRMTRNPRTLMNPDHDNMTAVHATVIFELLSGDGGRNGGRQPEVGKAAGDGRSRDALR